EHQRVGHGVEGNPPHAHESADHEGVSFEAETNANVQEQHVEAEREDLPYHLPVEVSESHPDARIAPADQEPGGDELERDANDLDEGQEDQRRPERQEDEREAEPQDEATQDNQVAH